MKASHRAASLSSGSKDSINFVFLLDFQKHKITVVTISLGENKKFFSASFYGEWKNLIE
jgi:hypothetical protein